MDEIIKLSEVYQEKIWGSEKWLISAHKNGQSTVVGGKYSGMTLSELFTEKKHLFGNINLTEFPLLVKIIDAKNNLSVQVHPDDEYAKKNENSLGKTECWYILDCNHDSDIVVGQKTTSREEMINAIENNQIEENLKIEPIIKNDFFYIPAGTVHAIRQNTKILEIQQSSDVTYRLYDYNRPGIDGNLRELHIDKALDVINYNATVSENGVKVFMNNNLKITTYVDNPFFTVKYLKVKEKASLTNKLNFICGVVIKGTCEINGINFKENESFLVPHGSNLQIIGTAEVVISYIDERNV